MGTEAAVMMEPVTSQLCDGLQLRCFGDEGCSERQSEGVCSLFNKCYGNFTVLCGRRELI